MSGREEDAIYSTILAVRASRRLMFDQVADGYGRSIWMRPDLFTILTKLAVSRA